MKRFISLTSSLSSLASLIALSGCAGVDSGPAATILAEVNDIATGSLPTRVAVAEVDGKPALLYGTKDDRVAFQAGDKRQLVDETARVRSGGGFFQLRPQGGKLHAMWWSHQSGKNIYFTSSGDGGQSFAPVSMVNDENGVLPPFTLVTDAEGLLGMTYQDERLGGYQAYFNRSIDNGLSWARPDQRLDAAQGTQTTNVHEPQMVQLGQTWVSAWTDIVRSSGATAYRIVARRSEDGGQRWSQPEVVHSAESQISSLIVKAEGGRIVAAADQLNLGIVAFASLDAGRSWRAAGPLSGTEKVSNSGIDLAVSGSRANLVWMQERQGEKIRIMRASLDVAQAKWLTDAAQRLDVKQTENTRSLSPSIIATKQGAVLAAWVDYRDIRPNIYLSASYDQGQNWSQPQAFLAPGEASAGWPQLVQWRDQVALGYELYPTDRAMEGKFFLRLLPAGENVRGLPGLPMPLQISEADRRAKLEQRVKTLWDNRIAGNYEPTFDMFDFAYKAVTPKKAYLDNVGVIIYRSASVNELTINGNEAAVKMQLRYEVQPTILPSTGKKITLPVADVEAATKWVWVGNDWFLMFTPSIEPPQLKY